MEANAINFDPLSDHFARDPYSVYAGLRRIEQPVYYEAMNAWLLPRYKEVEQVALNRACVRSLDAFMTPEQVSAERKKMKLARYAQSLSPRSIQLAGQRR